MRVAFILALLFPLTLTQQQLEEQLRFTALAKANDSAPPEQRLAYNALIVAFTAFREDHVATEARCKSDMCADNRIDEQIKVNEAFLDLAEHGPGSAVRVSAPVSEQMVIKTDAELNAAYEQVLAGLPESCPFAAKTCVSQSAFRNTQREWIRYRDAWQTYGRLRWPSAASAIWLVALTQQRTGQIAALAINR